MREEDRAVLTLPDRLAHILSMDNKMDASPLSTSSIIDLEQPRHFRDSREDSFVYKDSTDGWSDFTSRCRSSSTSTLSKASSAATPRSYQSTADRVTKHSEAIGLSLKFLNGIPKDTNSDASLMPGVQFKEFNDFSHSGILISNICRKKDKGSDERLLLPDFTMRPGAKINTMLRESQARKIANLQRCEISPSWSSGQQSLAPSNPQLAESNAFAAKMRGYFLDDAESIETVSLDRNRPMRSNSFQLKMRTSQELSFDRNDSFHSEEGEEYTLHDFQCTLEESSSEETVKTKHNWLYRPDQVMQPELDPCGILLAFDNMLDCFEPPDDNLNLSPQTLATWTPDDLFEEAVLEKDAIDHLLPCWQEQFDSTDFHSFDESTLDDLSHLDFFEDESVTNVEKMFGGLELESIPGKGISQDDTLTTDGDSTLSYDLRLY